MTVVEVKTWCGVQVAGHSKDVVQWWIWIIITGVAFNRQEAMQGAESR